LEFPHYIKLKCGTLATIYEDVGCGNKPLIGAYLTRHKDHNEWIPASWSREGKYNPSLKSTNLDFNLEEFKEAY
jgi:hypothetical protein